ncbi:MAG: hypothetical protein KGL95_03870, partial [Patescibacteria group bacterium]|nr:hypothetical protein [Patescibacteria group bacterium]
MNPNNITKTFIYVLNQSSVVNDTQVQQMVEASNILLSAFVQEWPVGEVLVQFVPSTGGNVPAAMPTDHVWNFIVKDNADVQGALAYHTEDAQDHVDGFIFAKTILDNGGTVLYAPRCNSTVASALFHEIVEALVDPTCNAWWQSSDGTMYAAEVADPVESNIVSITLTGGTVVGLSDFIFPAWRDCLAPNRTGHVRYNYMDTLSRPFQLDKGGYVVKIDPEGNQSTIFGRSFPAWKKFFKVNYGRLARRFRDHGHANDYHSHHQIAFSS